MKKPSKKKLRKSGINLNRSCLLEDLPVEPSLLKPITKVAKGMVLALETNNIGSLGVWPWFFNPLFRPDYTSRVDLSDDPLFKELQRTARPWAQGSGPLSSIKGELLKKVLPIRTDTGRFFEKAYANNMTSRNSRWGSYVKAKFNGILWEDIEVRFDVDEPLVQRMMWIFKAAGLGKTVGVDLSARSIAKVIPPKSQASLGLTVDPIRKQVIAGKKGQVWLHVQTVAYELIDYIQDKYAELLVWEKCDNREIVDLIITELFLFFISLLRIDGKPTNPRLIWAGNSLLYILECLICTGIKEDMKKSDIFAFSKAKIQSAVKRLSGFLLMLGDLSRWDLTQPRKFQRCVWRTWQELYRLPEWLMVLLYIYNVYAPLVRPDHGEVVVQARKGRQPSGSGAFTITNILLNLFYQYMAAFSLCSITDFGQLFGDNFFWPTTVGAKEWARYVTSRFSLRMKPEESMVTKETAVMLRFLVDMENLSVEPLIMSRSRNAICPKFRNPEQASEYYVATVLRAQSLEIVNTAISEDFSRKYKSLLKLWLKKVAPPGLMMPHMKDEELSRRLSMIPGGAMAQDTLDWVKRFGGVRETSDIFSQL